MKKRLSCLLIWILASCIVKAQRPLDCDYYIIDGIRVIRPTYTNLAVLALANPLDFTATMEAYNYNRSVKGWDYSANTLHSPATYTIAKKSTGIVMYFEPDRRWMVKDLRSYLQNRDYSYVIDDGFEIYKLNVTIDGIPYGFRIFLQIRDNYSTAAINIELQ